MRRYLWPLVIVLCGLVAWWIIAVMKRRSFEMLSEELIGYEKCKAGDKSACATMHCMASDEWQKYVGEAQIREECENGIGGSCFAVGCHVRRYDEKKAREFFLKACRLGEKMACEAAH